MEKKYLDYEGLVEVFRIVKERDTKLESDVTQVLNGMAEAIAGKADKDEVCDCEALTDDDIYDASGQDKPQAPKAEISITSPNANLDEEIVDPTALTIDVESTELIISLQIDYKGFNYFDGSVDVTQGNFREDCMYECTNMGRQDTRYTLYLTSFTAMQYLSEEGADTLETTIKVRTATNEISKSFTVKINKVNYFDPSRYGEGEYDKLTANITTNYYKRGDSVVKCFDSNGYKLSGTAGYLFQNATGLEYAKCHNLFASPQSNKRNLFDGATNLKHLELDGTIFDYTSSATNWFANCPNLEVLSLRNCSCDKLPQNFATSAFSGTNNIKILDVRGANLCSGFEPYAQTVLR